MPNLPANNAQSSSVTIFEIFLIMILLSVIPSIYLALFLELIGILKATLVFFFLETFLESKSSGINDLSLFNNSNFCNLATGLGINLIPIPIDKHSCDKRAVLYGILTLTLSTLELSASNSNSSKYSPLKFNGPSVDKQIFLLRVGLTIPVNPQFSLIYA